MMFFWQQMQSIKDKATGLANDFKIPCHRRLTLVQKDDTRIAISPYPQIKEISQAEEQFTVFSVRGQGRMFQVLGVSRQYERTLLEEQTTDYLIEDIRCELIEIKDEGLSWTLTLKENLGQQGLSVNNFGQQY